MGVVRETEINRVFIMSSRVCVSDQVNVLSRKTRCKLDHQRHLGTPTDKRCYLWKFHHSFSLLTEARWFILLVPYVVESYVKVL